MIQDEQSILLSLVEVIQDEVIIQVAEILSHLNETESITTCALKYT